MNTVGSFLCNCNDGFRRDRRGYCEGESLDIIPLSFSKVLNILVPKVNNRLCLSRTGNYQIYEFDLLEYIDHAVAFAICRKSYKTKIQKR